MLLYPVLLSVKMAPLFWYFLFLYCHVYCHLLSLPHAAPTNLAQHLVMYLSLFLCHSPDLIEKNGVGALSFWPSGCNTFLFAGNLQLGFHNPGKGVSSHDMISLSFKRGERLDGDTDSIAIALGVTGRSPGEDTLLVLLSRLITLLARNFFLFKKRKAYY
jgi:hypothetical protein